MEESGFSFDDFSVEMGDFEVRRVKEFDRVWRIGHGGSIASGIVKYKNLIYFGCADQNVYAINPENGELLWKFKTEGSIIEGSVTLHDDVIYFGSFDHNIYALHADNGKLIWKFRTSTEIGATAIFDDGILYFGSKDHNVYALDAKTGKLVWKFKTFGWISSEPVIVGNKLLIGSYDHFLYCLDKKTGKLIWKFETQGEIHNANGFAVMDGIIYFNSLDNYLRAVEISTGKLLWKKRLGHYGCSGGTLINGDVIFHPSRNGVLYAVSKEDGHLLWKFVTREVIGLPCIHGDKIYIGSCDFCMHCLSLDGKELWRFKTNGYVWYKNVMIGDRLYFGSWDCNLYCFDTVRRQVIWKFNTGGSPSPIPPPYEAFELQLKIPETTIEEEKKKTYEINITGEGEEVEGAYKSRTTYQLSSQYVSKGKYQIDSDEEAF